MAEIDFRGGYAVPALLLTRRGEQVFVDKPETMLAVGRAARSEFEAPITKRRVGLIFFAVGLLLAIVPSLGFGDVWLLGAVLCGSLLTVLDCPLCASTLRVFGFPTPFLALGLPMFAVLASSFGLRRISLAICIAGLLGAGYLQLTEPKLCPFCVAECGFLGLAARDKNSVKSWSLSRLCAGAIAFACLLLGIVAPTSATEKLKASALNLDGQSIASFTHGTPSPGLALVALEGCGSCELAQGDLAAGGIEYTILPTCESAANSLAPCWDFKKTPTAFPLVIISDQEGGIDYVRVGWPQDEQSRANWIKEIKSTLRRTQLRPSYGGKNK